MRWLYYIGIFFYSLLIRLVALFNIKAKQFVKGRQNIFETIAIKINPKEKHIWFHFASLGEFEQGKPILEKLKEKYPEKKIVITFFSPSGYEIRKNYALATGIFYLPMDTPNNAKKFIKSINPEIVIFTKYEYWFNYFNELKTNQIPLYVISAIFRPEQVFFKWYGNFYKNILKNVTHFFVQNQESMALLNSICINKASLSGDTRFDTVFKNSLQPKKLPEIEAFCKNQKTLICGSTWPADEKIIVSLANKYPKWKFIIAPHEISPNHIAGIEKLFPDALKFSKINSKKTAQVLIIDNIGLLSSLYQYGNMAYIGGGFGAGIHNTLEAAAFGLPIIFGPNYYKFNEAKDLITLGAAKSIANADELLNAFKDFIINDFAPIAAKNYIKENKGATAKILSQINL